jgi:hypothetical protein
MNDTLPLVKIAAYYQIKKTVDTLDADMTGWLSRGQRLLGRALPTISVESLPNTTK